MFEIATGTHTVTTLASFNGTNGAHPFGGLTADASGDLYGTTPSGGPGGIGLGTVFEIAHGSNAITTLASFGASSGGIPHGGVTLDASGNLYGTTEGDYTFRDGSVFEIPKGSNTITTLAAFDGYNGSAPVGDLAVDPSGNLYGTTESGGSSQAGTVFKIARGSSTITTLAVFNTANGALPGTGVILDPAGNLYGTTEEGGADGNGTVFEIPTGSTVLTTVASFDSAHGLSPGALIRDPGGNLFGTTIGGGTGREGTVFEIQQGSNAITTLMSFNGTNGARPDAITLDTLGNLFGTTAIGGPGNAGTAFELATNSVVTLAQTRGGNPAVTHEPLTFTATLSGGVPDGQTITLLDASNNYAVVASGTIIGGSASLTIPRDTLSAGSHHLIAVYGGDLTHAASASKPLILTILSPFFRPHRTP